MGKHTKYMEEIQAWKDFELELLIEPEPGLDPHYVGIIQGEDYIPTKEDDDRYTEMLYGDYFDYWNDLIEDYINNINDFDYGDYDYTYDD